MWRYLFMFLLASIVSAPVLAHDPYIEEDDWGDFDTPFVIPSDQISYALYGYLDEEDIDVFAISFDKTASLLRVELLVPQCGAHYVDFFPDYVILAPGIEDTVNMDLPFDIPEGYGVFFAENDEAPATDERETFLEPFGGTTFYEAPRHDLTVPVAGTYYIVLFDADGKTGDYSLATGYEERFGSGMARVLRNTSTIRSNGWLHRVCDLAPDDPNAIVNVDHAHDHAK